MTSPLPMPQRFRHVLHSLTLAPFSIKSLSIACRSKSGPPDGRPLRAKSTPSFIKNSRTRIALSRPAPARYDPPLPHDSQVLRDVGLAGSDDLAYLSYGELPLPQGVNNPQPRRASEGLADVSVKIEQVWGHGESLVIAKLLYNGPPPTSMADCRYRLWRERKPRPYVPHAPRATAILNQSAAQGPGRAPRFSSRPRWPGAHRA